MVEYNASLGPVDDLVVPYRSAVQWDGTNYFGASFAAFCSLGKAFGYRAVSCDDEGVNVALVREKLWPEPFRDGLEVFKKPRYGQNELGHPADTLKRPYLTTQHYLIEGVATVETPLGRISIMKKTNTSDMCFLKGDIGKSTISVAFRQVCQLKEVFVSILAHTLAAIRSLLPSLILD